MRTNARVKILSIVASFGVDDPMTRDDIMQEIYADANSLGIDDYTTLRVMVSHYLWKTVEVTTDIDCG